ncbi:hypothetical protein BB560_006643 [Smittium megazygosporum]|uniref:U4/U6.U5 small nuclear ribonucleoprotein 27kDa protein domain-containing protein n=1 Tax=Smittium megazygosporum TaxID=133381 RepID=A0A2T9Y2M7_9FUNG|nr:hypothetical protein BB560_006643 [Smittium megazygosporum]
MSTWNRSIEAFFYKFFLYLEKQEEDIASLMGFSGFSTTKGKAVFGNHPGAANIVKERKYRQYMNRRGGFNRPLDNVN